MSEHTEGEWEIERPCGFPYTGIYIVSHKANNNKTFHHFIAEVRQLREHAESEANAVLIAQAPTLLRQRAELVKALEGLKAIRLEDYQRTAAENKAWELADAVFAECKENQ